MAGEKKEKQITKYRDERGVRIQSYRRFQEGRDYEALDDKDMVALMDNVLDNIQSYKTAQKVGQPPKYETVDEFFSIVEQYFQYIRDANADDVKLIPDVEGLCAFMGISRETLHGWENARDKRYIDAIKMVKNQMAFCKKQLALKGKIPPIVFATDFNNNHGYTQKQEVVLTPNTPLGDQFTPEQIAQKYAELPEE